MTMNVFPLNAEPSQFGPSFIVYSDPNCTQRAAVYNMKGQPLPGSQVTSTGRQYQQFQCTATVLYTRDLSGYVETIYPHPFASSPVVTGSKGSNAALTSLIAALAAQGLITDQTT